VRTLAFVMLLLGSAVGHQTVQGQARVGGVAAADPASGPVAFEVASVKPNKSGPRSPQRAGLQPGDRVTMINVPLLVLVQIAYPGMSEIVGAPNWMGHAGTPNFEAERFDVNAKAERPATVEQLRLMLRGLLADRFKLAVHSETRPKDVYALRLARADGRLGPNLHPAAADCRSLVEANSKPSPGTHPCGTVGTDRPPWHVLGVRISQLTILNLDAGRPIVDKTGLTGAFDFDLNWTPRWALDPSFDRARLPGVDFDGPDIFTAVQEQLGLKLVSEKDDQPVLVVDHVEQPTRD